MHVTRVFISSFRNYARLDLFPVSGVNVFYGPNGSGKTNLLESLFCLSAGYSHRTGREADLIQHGQDGFTLRAELQGGGAGWVQVQYERERGRQWRAAGGSSSRHEMGVLFPVVLFAPEDLDLASGQPAARRRFLDQLCAQLVPSYHRWLTTYARVLVQRNELLREAQARHLSGQLLEAWDEELGELGGKLWGARQAILKRFNVFLAEQYSSLAGESAALKWWPALDGVGGAADGEGEAATWGALLQEQLGRNRREEIRQGATLRGPHRDILSFETGDEDVRQFGSRGQQRGVVLAARLAQQQLLRDHHGTDPVLLLDDVFAELDAGRRQTLLRGIPQGAQVFLTCTQPATLPIWSARRARYFRVGDGTVTDEGEDSVPPTVRQRGTHQEDAEKGDDFAQAL